MILTGMSSWSSECPWGHQEWQCLELAKPVLPSRELSVLSRAADHELRAGNVHLLSKDALSALFPFIFSSVKVDSCPQAHVAWLGEDASPGRAGAMEMVQGHGLGWAGGVGGSWLDSMTLKSFPNPNNPGIL